MAAKKTTQRKRTARTSVVSGAALTPQDKFTGLTGTWKAVAAFGVIGCMAATNMYQTLYTTPKAQKDHIDAIAVMQSKFTESIENRSQTAYAHGEKAVDRLSNSIEKVGDKFGSVQGVTQGNQRALLQEQQRTNELLEKHVIASETDGVLDDGGGWVPVKPRASKRP